MRRRSGRLHKHPEWVALAQPYEHHLDAANPLLVLGAGEVDDEVGFGQVHIHKGMDVLIVVAGEMEQRGSDVSEILSSGDVWLGAMWEPHYWRVLRPHTETVLFVFLPEVLEEAVARDLPLLDMFAVPASQRPRATTPQLRARVLEIAAEVTREFQEKPLGWQTMVRAALVRLLTILARHWQPGQPARPHPVRASDLARIMPALALVQSRLQTRTTPSQAAAACSMSLSLFHRVFTHTMGVSYGQFCRRARLAFASHLLVDTELSVEAVAREAGFVDASHLHHRFAAQYGCTPAEYRSHAGAQFGSVEQVRAEREIASPAPSARQNS